MQSAFGVLPGRRRTRGGRELIPAGPLSTKQASLGFRTSRGAGGIRLEQINCSFPARIERPPLAPEPAGEPDVFLNGIELATLNNFA